MPWLVEMITKFPILRKEKICATTFGKLPESLPVSEAAKDALEELGFARYLSDPM
jgi:hypothetical protein